MACEKRPYLCVILVLCSLALLFHIVGFVTPGWLILRRSVEDDSFFMKGQMIDKGGVVAPKAEDDDEPKPMFRKRRSEEDHQHGNGPHHDKPHPEEPPHGKPHHGKPGHGRPHHDGPHHERPHHDKSHDRDHDRSHDKDHERDHDKPRHEKEDMTHDRQKFEAWMMEATLEKDTFDIRTSYGLWYSTVCIHEKKTGDHDSEEKRMDMDSSSSDDDDDDHRKGHCRCKKVSTKTALSYAFMYEDFMFSVRNGGYLSYKNFGNACLTEHRVENCLVFAFMVLGLIAAIAGFKKVNGCRCAGVACVVFMLLAAFVALVPVARFSHYSLKRGHQDSNVRVHTPYSAIATGLGSLFALTTALVAGCALMKTRKDKAGRWYQFNNELPNEDSKEKPGLYFTAEALPAKPGLYDVCDFGDVKPIEEVKKPEAEEESGEFVL